MLLKTCTFLNHVHEKILWKDRTDWFRLGTAGPLNSSRLCDPSVSFFIGEGASHIPENPRTEKS